MWPADDEDRDPPAGELEQPAEDDEVVDGEVQPDRRLSQPSHFIGPLPPPNTLDEYNEVQPGLARDIVDQWKGETAHRRRTVDHMAETDREAMRAFYAGEKRGQYLAVLVIFGVLAVATLSVALDRPIVGVGALILAAASAAWAVRRGSDTPPSTQQQPVDVGNGDDVEDDDSQGRG